MVRRSSTPAAIEASEICVSAQDIRPSDIPRPTADDEMVFPLQVKKRATGTITRESDPKVAKYRNYSLLDLDDQISGDNLWGFSSLPLTRDSIRVGQAGRTASHSGQDATLDGRFCFLEIVSGWRGAPLPIHPMQELLA